jgi:hypothetical protein
VVNFTEIFDLKTPEVSMKKWVYLFGEVPCWEVKALVSSI